MRGESEGEASGTPLAAVRFAVVDVETTGTNPRAGDRVTEVAVVTVSGGTIEPAFRTLVNPERPIPSFIAALTGINDGMVRDAPVFSAVAGTLASHLAGHVFVAHNASFDWAFLDAEYSRVASGDLAAITAGRLCTVRLARRLLRHLPRRNLDAVCAHYGVTIEGRHRADGDARATAHVLVGLIRDAERSGVYSLEGLLVCGRPQRRKSARRTALPHASDAADGA